MISDNTFDETSHVLDDLFDTNDGILLQQKEFEMYDFSIPALSYDDDMCCDSFLDIDINPVDNQQYLLSDQLINTPSVECQTNNAVHTDHLYSKSPLDDASVDLKSPASSGYESETVTSPLSSEHSHLEKSDDVVQELLTMLCQTSGVSTINFDDLDPATLDPVSNSLQDVLSPQHTDNVIDLDNLELDSDIDNDDSNSCTDDVIAEKDSLPFTVQDVKRCRRYTGNKLRLSDEEKTLLAKEGIQLPTDVPLTKEEEKLLKSVRRKIRNKISAKVSRKRKQEYVDGLEKRVKLCTSQNQQLQLKVQKLEKQNSALIAGLKNLYLLFTNQQQQQQQPELQQTTTTAGIRTNRPPTAATCFMVLMLSFALIGIPLFNPFSDNNEISPKPRPVVTGSARKLLDYRQNEVDNSRNALFKLENRQEQASPDTYSVNESPVNESLINESVDDVTDDRPINKLVQQEQNLPTTNNSYSVYYAGNKANEL